MYNPSYQKSNHRLWAILMLLVLLALSGIGVASAKQISVPDENPANAFVSEPAGLELSDGGDPAQVSVEPEWVSNSLLFKLQVLHGIGSN